MLKRTKYIRHLQDELRVWNVDFEEKEKVSKLEERLKKHEQVRYEEALSVELTKLGVEYADRNLTEKLRLLKTTLDEREMYCSSEWDIDTNKYFKCLGTYTKEIFDLE